MKEEIKTNEEKLTPAPDLKPAAEASKAQGDMSLDDMFEVSQDELTEAPEDEVRVVESEWKFPGVKVIREPFSYKGRRCYSYKAKINMLWNGNKVPLEAELNSADRRNPDSYGKLDMLFDALPENQKTLLLGFQYQDYSKTYSYCVQMEDANGIPMRVTLQPRNATARDNLATMISVLKSKGRL